MRMLLSSLRLPTSLCVLFCLAALSACASKNPLIDEPKTAATPARSTTAAAPAAVTPAPAAASGNQQQGVQLGKERRLFGMFSPYRVDIQQGNFVSREMVAQLRPGMTPDQVRFVLGTPLLNDIFHADRWDYVFRLEKGNGTVISSRMTVHFKDGRLARVEDGNLPTENDYLSLIAGHSPPAKSSTANAPTVTSTPSPTQPATTAPVPAPSGPPSSATPPTKQ